MKKLRLATVFSGIGAPEQALNKMNIPYDIVFACDNGERELQLTKEEIIEKATKKETVKKTVKKETTETMAEATKTPRKMTKVSDTVLEIFETKVSMKDLEAVIKKEVKATVSGIYITAVKGVRGSLETPPKKKGFWARLRNK